MEFSRSDFSKLFEIIKTKLVKQPKSYKFQPKNPERGEFYYEKLNDMFLVEDFPYKLPVNEIEAKIYFKDLIKDRELTVEMFSLFLRLGKFIDSKIEFEIDLDDVEFSCKAFSYISYVTDIVSNFVVKVSTSLFDYEVMLSKENFVVYRSGKIIKVLIGLSKDNFGAGKFHKVNWLSFNMVINGNMETFLVWNDVLNIEILSERLIRASKYFPVVEFDNRIKTIKSSNSFENIITIDTSYLKPLDGKFTVVEMYNVVSGAFFKGLSSD